MHPHLTSLYGKLESQREATLVLVSRLNPEEFNRKPLPEKWSAAQILSHLITAEQLSVRYMQKKILGIKNVEDTGLWGEIKILILKLSQRLPGLRFKAPKVVVQHTQHYTDLETIRTEWEKVRQELKVILEKIPAGELKRKIYKHAFAGYLNISQGLIFMHEHVVHHTPQLKRLLPEKQV